MQYFLKMITWLSKNLPKYVPTNQITLQLDFLALTAVLDGQLTGTNLRLKKLRLTIKTARIPCPKTLHQEEDF